MPSKTLPRALARLNKQLDKLEMAEALSVSDDPAHQALALMLRGCDPATGIRFKEIESCTLGRLCQRTGVSYKQIITVYRDFKRSQAVIGAAQRLPGIVQGIAEDAEARDLTCASCEGSGAIAIKRDGEGLPVESKRCIPCEGIGKIRQPGDPVARKQILEMMELSGRAATPINAPGANILVAGGDSLEETLRAARQSRGSTNGRDQSRDVPMVDSERLGLSGSEGGA